MENMKKALQITAGLLIMAGVAGVGLVAAWFILSTAGEWLFGDQCNRQIENLNMARRNNAKPSTIEYQERQVEKACSQKSS